MQKLALAFAACSTATATSVTPVQKVVQLMEGMLAKGKEEKHKEEVQFAAYKQFCDDTEAEKERAIQEATEEIEGLNADIEKYTNDAARLTKEVAVHNEDVAAWSGDVKAATAVRKTENADYQTTHTDYSESIDALERAIAVLKKQAFDRKQASLIQVQALTNLDLIPAAAKKTIDAFLQDSDDASLDAPEANGYEFQSSGVIEMLEKLLDKFTAERTALEKEEANSKHAFDMLVQDLSAQIDQAKSDVDLKTQEKTKKLGAKATAEGDVADTTETRKEDQKYLRDLVATCEQKSTDFASRQQLRAEELEAVAKAIEIVSSGAVAGNADKHLPSLVQKSALAQLRAGSANQNRVVEYLTERATQLNSRVLLTLAQRASSDPFEKVKKMIKELIVRLMEEANEEAEHKGWCDTELATNEQTRTEKTNRVESLRAENDQMTANVAQLTEQISELTSAVSALDAAMAKATGLRQDEKAKNTQTIKDSQEAQTAVAQALTVLKEFYAKAAEATALVQQQPEAPETFNEPYQGMGGENGGVVGMLEVIESDFARLESDTSASEANAQREYDTFMTDSKVDKEAKTTDIEHKTTKKQDISQALVVNEEDIEGTQKELDAALRYFDKLKPSCVDSGVSYEERVARREEEIQSLQEALKILAGEDLA